ncbi:MAG: hypothetical protein WBH86_02695 [Thermogutta sp.]|nr:hypothetical protein [Thermogutta sp.]HOP77383.1 hypothetical protein [Thermogutta sp.]HPU06925.1 hypothetical protein [Thermogutta sp.]
MDRLKKAALLTRLIKRLREEESWCGETHVQKATFFLQRLMQVPLGFDFILYKHGPFSFDLRDELTALRADDLVRLEPQGPYGPRIAATERSKYIEELYSKTLAEYGGRIDFVAKSLGRKGVADLERLATALYITELAGSGASVNERANQMTALKPHIPPEIARDAIEQVDRIIREAQRYLPA